MTQESDKLKLGKGQSFFVKSQLCRLRQQDDTWEADFFLIPYSDGAHETVWMGMVLSHSHDNILAQNMVGEPPNVNDLAQLLAEAMRRPLVELSHRPRTLYLREKPEWANLLPHLKQVGIQVVSQSVLPKWDEAFGDLQAQAEQVKAASGTTLTKGWPLKKDSPAAGRKKSMARTKESAAGGQQSNDPGKVRVYTLDASIPRTPVHKTFSKTKSRVYRTIQIRGDQTLEDLHHAIFDAFDRDNEHLYEFQLGKGARDRLGPTYVLEDYGAGNVGGLVTETTIDSLRLNVGRSFGYLFDFGDCWQHQINVEAVEEVVSQGTFPRVTKRVGESPPQYPDQDE